VRNSRYDEVTGRKKGDVRRRTSALRRVPLLRVEDDLLHALVDVNQVLVNAVKGYLFAGRPSNALIQHAHAYGAGRRLPLEEGERLPR